MDFIISLAHFCELHGPTSIVCTHLPLVSCPQCHPHQHDEFASTSTSPPTSPTPVTPPSLERATSNPRSRSRLDSAPHSRHPSFSRRSQNLLPLASPKSALQDVAPLDVTSQSSAIGILNGGGECSGASFTSSLHSSPFRTPPGSPASLTGQSQPESEFATSEPWKLGGRGPSHIDGLASEICGNCCFSIPRSISEQLPRGAPGSLSGNSKGGNNGSPVLRTREVVDAGPSASRDSPEEDSSNEDSDSSTKPTGPTASEKAKSRRPTISRNSSSFTSLSSSTSTTPSRPSETHTHTLTFITTRVPPHPSAHSLLRRSCIRTLSHEHLPRPNKGPLFFGDDTAGYTLAYLFRLTDPSARGRSRRYAFVCWAGRDERRAARVWKDVLSVFERCAAGIEALVEKRQEEMEVKREAQAESERDRRAAMGMEGHAGSRDHTPVSSFLGGRAVDIDGLPRRGAGAAGKGLAELCGREELFVELHAVFVRLLTKLGRLSGVMRSSASSVNGADAFEMKSRDPQSNSEKPMEDLVTETDRLNVKGAQILAKGGGRERSKDRRSASRKRAQDRDEVSPKTTPATRGTRRRSLSRGPPNANASATSVKSRKGMEGLKGKLVAV